MVESIKVKYIVNDLASTEIRSRNKVAAKACYRENLPIRTCRIEENNKTKITVILLITYRNELKIA